MNKIKELLLFNLKLLFFRTSRENFDSIGSDHLKFGLFCTWIVGMGRWWDDPNANILQLLGLGSIIYIFVLSVIIWLIVSPLKPRNWSYKHVLTFISLTSLPAILYAIPVERFVSIDTAIELNTYFLTVVAIWRVALLFFYLARHADLSLFYRTVAGLLPLAAIVTSLTILNLHKVVFNIMGGLREASKNPYDGAYSILFLLTFFSMLASIPLLLCYLGAIVNVRKSQEQSTKASDQT